MLTKLLATKFFKHTPVRLFTKESKAAQFLKEVGLTEMQKFQKKVQEEKARFEMIENEGYSNLLKE
jgi:hypothetical protein